MALKITSRFAPSIVKAAHMLETSNALHAVPADHAHYDKARQSFDQLNKRINQMIDASGAGFVTALEQIIACADELQAERKRKAQERRARREALAREHEMAQQLIGA
jgi:hypothetical protein